VVSAARFSRVLVAGAAADEVDGGIVARRMRRGVLRGRDGGGRATGEFDEDFLEEVAVIGSSRVKLSRKGKQRLGVWSYSLSMSADIASYEYDAARVGNLSRSHLINSSCTFIDKVLCGWMDLKKSNGNLSKPSCQRIVCEPTGVCRPWSDRRKA